jgi:hypothetical protein
MPFYTTEQLGPTQSLTPDGFLLCERVPIARTGTQLYGPGEVPVEAGSDGIIRIIRDESEVFRPETIASFEGKPVTLDHPALFVGPETWKELTVGVVQNVRRGDGFDSDLLLADLLITDAAAIKLVRAEPDDDKPGQFKRPLREVSCGYDANYVQESPGVGYQRDIIGNHVALVERGRAGSRCSIQDKEPENMTTPTKDNKPSLIQRLMARVFTMDEAQLEQLVNDSDESDEDKEKKATQDSIAALTASVATLAKTVDALVKGKTADGKTGDDDEELDENGNPKGKAKDADSDLTDPEAAAKLDESGVYTGDSLKDIVSRAEILAPGFSMPTTDSVKSDAVVTLQRNVLAEAMKTTDGQKVVAPFLAGRDLAKMTADALSAVFVAASELARQTNNARGAQFGRGNTTDHRAVANRVVAMNEAAQKFWTRS